MAEVEARDLAQLFVKSVEAPNIQDEHGIPFQIFYGISGNARLPEHRERATGYWLRPGERRRDQVRR
jgi:hypothetical protein